MKNWHSHSRLGTQKLSSLITLQHFLPFPVNHQSFRLFPRTLTTHSQAPFSQPVSPAAFPACCSQPEPRVSSELCPLWPLTPLTVLLVPGRSSGQPRRPLLRTPSLHPCRLDPLEMLDFNQTHFLAALLSTLNCYCILLSSAVQILRHISNWNSSSDHVKKEIGKIDFDSIFYLIQHINRISLSTTTKNQYKNINEILSTLFWTKSEIGCVSFHLQHISSGTSRTCRARRRLGLLTRNSAGLDFP